MKKVIAKNLRNKDQLFEIPKDMPGWYRWWAPTASVEVLLNSSYIEENYFDTIFPYLTTQIFDGMEYYYIYVGVAIRESIRDRLDWHVNQHHTLTSVKSGFLSTFRQSISSLVARNQFDEEATNKMIDTFVIEYEPIDLSIKSEEAKEMIEQIETTEMAQHTLPINIKDNKNTIVKDFLVELKKVRKESKGDFL